jgi:hypothetical protein
MILRYPFKLIISTATLALFTPVALFAVQASGNINVSASVNFVLLNAIKGKENNLSPPAPSSNDLSTLFNNTANAGTTVVYPSSNGDPDFAFAPASNMAETASTPITITTTDTNTGDAVGKPTLNSTDAGNTTKIEYHVVYTPCKNGAPLNLETCTTASPCNTQLTGSVASEAVCETNPGSMQYKYDLPKPLYAGTYAGGLTVNYSVGN